MHNNIDNILNNLTQAQHDAVTHIDGPMLVVAGAGSGKTRVVTHRIAWLMQQGVNPNNILTMTFTNKASKEMKERIIAMTGISPRWMGTFHSVCALLLRSWLDYYDEDPRNSRFVIYDTDDQKKLLKALFKEHGHDEKRDKLTANNVSNYISNHKNSYYKINSIFKEHSSSNMHDITCAKFARLYEESLRASNAFDFDDLLIMIVKIFETRSDLLAQAQDHFQYIMVDEYQDTNKIQYQLLKYLAGERANLHVTGDPDQSIYSWRGAQYRNIMEFSTDFQGAKIVRLERNYRSTGNILSVANHLIDFNTNRIEKKLYTESGEGDKVVIGKFWGDREEAVFVANKIMQLMNSGNSLADIAILYRTNAQSRAFEDAFLRIGISYQIIGGIKFYERKEVKDFIAYLRLRTTPNDYLALDRVLNSRSFGVGKTSLDNLRKLASIRNQSVCELLLSEDFIQAMPKASMKLREFIKWLRGLFDIKNVELALQVNDILAYSGLLEYYKEELKNEKLEGTNKKNELYPSEERLKNLESFIDRAHDFEPINEQTETQLEDFLAEIALNSSTDEMKDFEDKVTMMTLHCSKGLEFPFVFVGGLEEGLLPHANSFNNGEKDVEEERRLFYVGITRAEKKLFITLASSRYSYGTVIQTQPSRFLRELPIGCLDFAGNDKMTNNAASNDLYSQNRRFSQGGAKPLSSYSNYGNGRPSFNNQRGGFANNADWLRKKRQQRNDDNYYDYDDL